jgi:hypothetical protein
METTMKRPFPAIVVLLLGLVGALALFQYGSVSPLHYAEVEGHVWDKDTQGVVSVVIRIDDRQVLDQVRPWRNELRRKARDQALQGLMSSVSNRRHCESAFRQPWERLTLVYEDGHREIENVDVYKTPLGDLWQEARKKGAGMNLLSR